MSLHLTRIGSVFTTSYLQQIGIKLSSQSYHLSLTSCLIKFSLQSPGMVQSVIVLSSSCMLMKKRILSKCMQWFRLRIRHRRRIKSTIAICGCGVNLKKLRNCSHSTKYRSSRRSLSINTTKYLIFVCMTVNRMHKMNKLWSGSSSRHSMIATCKIWCKEWGNCMTYVWYAGTWVQQSRVMR